MIQLSKKAESLIENLIDDHFNYVADVDFNGDINDRDGCREKTIETYKRSIRNLKKYISVLEQQLKIKEVKKEDERKN